MELTVPFLMGCLERSIVNGKREYVVFDAAVGASGYVSGYTRPRRTVCPQCDWTLYAVATHFSFRFHPGIANDRTRATAMCRG